MRVLKNLFGDGSKINAEEIAVQRSGAVKTLKDAVLKSGDWIDGALYYGWAGTFKYKKTDDGQVAFKIQAVPGTKGWGNAIGEFPAGYAPTVFTPFNIFMENGMTIEGASVNPDGTIRLYNPAVGEAYSGLWYISGTYVI